MSTSVRKRMILVEFLVRAQHAPPGIVAIGADNIAVEVLPNPGHGLALPTHQFALSQYKIYLIENLALEKLAADGVYTPCFVFLATTFRGATGSPVRAGGDGVGRIRAFRSKTLNDRMRVRLFP